jgi:dihydrofolate reductase
MMHVFIIAAVTADGFIAQTTDQKSTRWTSKEDYLYFTQRTKQAGAVVMGSTTYQTIGHPLSDRLTLVQTRHPQPSTTPKLRYTHQSPHDIVAMLELEKYTELAICGGASIYTLWLESGLVDSMYLTTHTDVNFGSGIPLFTKPINLPQPSKTTPLSETTILNEYRIK